MPLELHYQPNDLMELYKTYMPYVKGGGLFIKSKETALLDESVSVHVKLPFHEPIFHFTSQIIWISPEKTLLDSATVPGLGVQIPDGDSQEIRHLIEVNIEEYLDSAQPTDTM